MATQMQPASSKSSIPGIIYAGMILVFSSTIFLAFCGPTAERAIKQLDEISACRDNTDACNAPPEGDAVPTFEDVQINPDGTPDGTCKARYPDAEGNLPPEAAFDANHQAPPHCVYVQDPGGEVWSAYTYNQDPSRQDSDGGGWGMVWGTFFRVFRFLAVLIFGWFFWGKWRRAKRHRKELGVLSTQPIDPETGGPKLPQPVPIPGAPDDDFDDDGDDDEDYR
jgi:hypothetical protein